MKSMTQTLWPLLLSALLLAGTAALAQPKADPDPAAGQKLAATIDATSTARAIQAATFDDREVVLTGIEARMKAVDEILGGLPLSDSGKDDVRKVTDALTEHVKKSRDSTAADWKKVRASLGDRYQAYADTVLRVQQDAANAR